MKMMNDDYDNDDYNDDDDETLYNQALKITCFNPQMEFIPLHSR